ncbi:MAG: hypothetical protein L6Q54_05215 [Leptospiraceae bacterium]|nr:hypothetical protein [Leptospiraceae bacterium]NUM41077.1 class I SAM-dependent methyltransferase [Leptospiraceae bacterium]
MQMKILKKLIDPKFLLSIPSRIKYILIRFYHEKIVFKSASKETIFTSIWRNNYWGNNESLSGIGSTLEQTAKLREQLPLMFPKFGIKSVFDAPCGDLNWMQHILNKGGFNYLGGDIVSAIVEKNNKKFSNQNVNFIKFDITIDTFPVADLWICRAVLYHLSNLDVYLALEKFSESKIKYILTTNCVTDSNHTNKDIHTGDWRSLNLTLPPFNFPKDSLWEIDDYVDPHPPMTISLWTKEQIESVLPNLRKIYKH